MNFIQLDQKTEIVDVKKNKYFSITVTIILLLSTILSSSNVALSLTLFISTLVSIGYNFNNFSKHSLGNLEIESLAKQFSYNLYKKGITEGKIVLVCLLPTDCKFLIVSKALLDYLEAIPIFISEYSELLHVPIDCCSGIILNSNDFVSLAGLFLLNRTNPCIQLFSTDSSFITLMPFAYPGLLSTKSNNISIEKAVDSIRNDPNLTDVLYLTFYHGNLIVTTKSQFESIRTNLYGMKPESIINYSSFLWTLIFSNSRHYNFGQYNFILEDVVDECSLLILSGQALDYYHKKNLKIEKFQKILIVNPSPYSSCLADDRFVSVLGSEQCPLISICYSDNINASCTDYGFLFGEGLAGATVNLYPLTVNELGIVELISDYRLGEIVVNGSNASPGLALFENGILSDIKPTPDVFTGLVGLMDSKLNLYYCGKKTDCIPLNIQNNIMKSGSVLRSCETDQIEWVPLWLLESTLARLDAELVRNMIIKHSIDKNYIEIHVKQANDCERLKEYLCNSEIFKNLPINIYSA